ncbi:hypothetical protein [Candidatus Fokinia crypta]|uniref:Uncharacterized protein n=1 Tax=Candidatus Fokinia crypta TaxID=1920990 RepID=A0ABZ0UT60_9RICK|nr:hypothetical protein [Candidatus Fokinia cryptica]WPX98115.1 hypothetical protein Fokcrypt_00649 [Candidatus Fokinia cryptica]
MEEREKCVDTIIDIVNIIDTFISNKTLRNSIEDSNIYENRRTKITQVILEILEMMGEGVVLCNTLLECMKLISEHLSIILLLGHYDTKLPEQKLRDIKQKLINTLLHQFNFKVQFQILKRVRSIMKKNIEKIQQESNIEHLIKELNVNDGGLDRYTNFKIHVCLKTSNNQTTYSSKVIDTNELIINTTSNNDKIIKPRN